MSVTTQSATHEGRKEWQLLSILAAIQFTNLMDFVILMPLGPQLMRVFSVSAQEFGLIVSAYTFSAGIAGFIGALFIDRFDRKTAILTLYTGFAVSNLLCALAPTYVILLAARVVAGAFGGIMSATAFTIVGDVIPEARRGAAMGFVMMSFSFAQVVGVPTGLVLANAYGWHIPFYMLAGTSTLVILIAVKILPPIRGHFDHRTDESAFRSLFSLLTKPEYIKAFIFVSSMMFAGFAVIPYISPFVVSNVGLSEGDLPYIYLLGGAATMFTARYFGKVSDRIGKHRAFALIGGFSAVPLLLLTNLPKSPLWVTLVVTTLFMILVSGRSVPAMALITSSVEPGKRGSFMSVNSSVIQLSSGAASFVGGSILGTSASGQITNYGLVGVLAVATSFLSIYLSRKIRSTEAKNVPTPLEELPVEAV
ncbi:MAG: hypothetical protein A3H45_03645 [Ignavibacteria bacterium RIFCSPLOWO2_02_FULL_55_14]|nr:MAG: hypothetical protein A2X68_02255 [Ignavibacteria bacterium GWC2_56_12]OGU64854.1 MAG: hypothetical protein A3C56_05560 [Ignavibacteria bacterium RIFCSPHIGHO2_02_FULL_56_12]OGU72093.1 MAG: hypothetical protein A3H45_03645 [Ignavibacteria bacterium RIFCSPLOWO2_02_FULL_55_14]OGU73822.1 MAG: hypothetical protein A3G43_06015 [Ignavibacteria bacterium RIFCSPLOWO2_12_FULL_56_21]HAV22631.1 MFS transporter [Bacteroidota bacterium]